MREKKILQITPANNWEAIFKDRDVDITRSLACWALVQYEDESTGVEGMVGDLYVDFAQDTINFVGYKYSTPMHY